MNKLIVYVVLFFSLFVTGCSNDKDAEASDSGGKQISVIAQIKDGNDLRVAYADDGNSMKATWSKEEKFTMYNGSRVTGTEFCNSSEEVNTFKGVKPTGNDTYYGVYGNNLTKELSNGGGILNVNIAEQTGSIEEKGLTEFMVAESADLNTVFRFKHKLTVLKLKLTLPEKVTGTVRKVYISGLYVMAEYGLIYDKFFYRKEGIGTIEATNRSMGFSVGADDHLITVYVAVFPQTVVANSVTIRVVADNGTYGYTLKTDKRLNAGTVVPVTVALQPMGSSVYDYVDFELPSGNLWATRNIGAAIPEDVGNLYAWGETSVKNDYSWENYLCSDIECGGEGDPLKMYTDISGTTYDVARKELGESWKMPRRADVLELAEKTTINKVTRNVDGRSVSGLEIKSKTNDNSIFIPFGLTDQDVDSYVWLSTIGSDSKVAQTLSYGATSYEFKMLYRKFGLPVRPILTKWIGAGEVTANEWGVEYGGDTNSEVMSVSNLCGTDTYKAQREALTTLTVDGATFTDTDKSFLQTNFGTYFPNVKTLRFTGEIIAKGGMKPRGVNTILSDAVSVPKYCFKDGYQSTIRNASFPKLRAFSGQILFGISMDHVCFATLTDCSNADQEFTTNNIHIAFGATDEFNFGTKTPKNIVRDFCNTATLYLNENGYEYQNNVSGNKWRGVEFQAIKKYSEYTGKKD